MAFEPTEGKQTWLQYGARLVKIRADLSQAVFAPKVGVHKNTLGHYERGIRELGADALRSLVYLGWNANWVLTGEGPERLDEFVTSAAPDSQPVKLERLTMALQLASEALEGKGLTLPTPKRALFVASIYDLLEEGVPEAKVLNFARNAAG